ncbi:hypothetical protein ACLB2K_035465 [Fragaria x ananassa]
MGRGGERDLSHFSNGSTSRSRPPRVDEEQLQEMQQRYEQRLKESDDRAQQQLTESQVTALYEHLGMPPPPPPQFPPPPPDASPPPHVSPQNNDDLSDNIELDSGLSSSKLNLVPVARSLWWIGYLCAVVLFDFSCWFGS